MRVKHLSSVELVTDASILHKMTVDKLKYQLAKYRAIDEQARGVTGLRKKEQILKEVMDAAACYMHQQSDRIDS